MSKFKVFVTRMIPQEGIDLLQRVADVEINPEDRPLSRTELLDKVQGCDGVIGLLTDQINSDFFDAASSIKGYANYAVGYDNIDVPEATKRGIPVSNTPGVLTDATAECAWALIFSVARRVVETDSVMRSDTWTGWGPLQFIGGDTPVHQAGEMACSNPKLMPGSSLLMNYSRKRTSSPSTHR